MWQDVAEAVRVGADRVSGSLNEYGPPMELPAFASAWKERAGKYIGRVRDWADPPPPPPPSLGEQAGTWLVRHRTLAAYALGGAVVVGLGIALHRVRPQVPTSGTVVDGRRTQAVIVLGGDTPLGRALTLSLAARNLIVLPSVSSDQAKRALEFEVPPPSKGYVKALVLDANDPTSAEDKFVHAVHAALCMRYPLTTAGDPYARPGENVQVIGVVNALSFAPDADVPDALARSTPARLEEALRTHVVTPLSTINRLMALLTALPNRVQRPEEQTPALVLSLVSLPDVQVAQPLHGAAPIIAQSVRAGISTLRRESDQQYLAQRTNHPLAWTWLGTSRQTQQRPLRWTLVEVDATRSAPFSQVQPSDARELVGPKRAPPAPKKPRDILDKVAQLLFSRGTPLWPTYRVRGTSRLGHALGYLWASILAVLPTSILDVLVATNLRFAARSTGTIHDHLHRVVADATAPPPSLRPGNGAASGHT